MTRNVSIEDATVEITAGEYDTSEGFRAQVEGDEFPRVHISPQGVIATGDGTAAPTPLGSGSSAVAVAGTVSSDTDLVGGDFTQVQFTDPYSNPTNLLERAQVVGVAVIQPYGDDIGIYTVTETGPCTPTVVLAGSLVVSTDGYVYLAQGYYPGSAVTNYSVLDPTPPASGIVYDNSTSGLSAGNVQEALDELAAALP